MKFAGKVGGIALWAALALAAPIGPGAMAGDEQSCELKIRGHSIFRLTLVEKSRPAGVQFIKPGETVKLPAGAYRVEQVVLEGGSSLRGPQTGSAAWFDVSPGVPNELVVGAPLHPTASVKRRGAFLQLDYDLVDGAGRSYRKPRDYSQGAPQPPRFTVFKDGRQIGSGSFKYG